MGCCWWEQSTCSGSHIFQWGAAGGNNLYVVSATYSNGVLLATYSNGLLLGEQTTCSGSHIFQWGAAGANKLHVVTATYSNGVLLVGTIYMQCQPHIPMGCCWWEQSTCSVSHIFQWGAAGGNNLHVVTATYSNGMLLVGTIYM